MKIEDRIRDDLWKAIQAHYERTDYTEAVRDAVFHMSEVLREKGGIEDKDGTKLVETALLGSNPAILVNKNETTTEKDFQQGIGFAFKGIMQSVRNPLSHESFQYTQDEAEVLILYINFLLNQVDKSGGGTKIDNIIDLLLDDDFTDTQEYADLLLKEVPTKKRYDLILELYQRRADLPRNKLKFFLTVLFSSLTKAAKSDFVRVVSSSLMKCKDDNNLRMYCHYFMKDTYAEIDKLAQLRIENMMLKSIKNGRVSYNLDEMGNEVAGCDYKGSLATWISDSEKLDLLSNKNEIIQELFYGLMSEDVERENYVFEYFRGIVFNSSLELTQRQIKHIKSKLNSGDKRYSDALCWDMEFEEDNCPWYGLFKDEYAACKKIIEERNELPF